MCRAPTSWVWDERMKSASSTPGRILPELNHFLGSLQSAGPHRGFTNKCPIPLCHLLSLLAREEGSAENIAEPWGFSRTKEAEVVQEVLESPQSAPARQRCQDARLCLPPPGRQPGAAGEPDLHRVLVGLLP